MDTQVAIELGKIIPKKLQVDYDKKLKDASKEKRTVMGRQLVRLCIQFFRTNTHEHRVLLR